MDTFGEADIAKLQAPHIIMIFQSRRFNIRYNDGGVKQYVHSLNATAIPTPRVLVSIVENFQEEDGSIRVPEALQPYLGKSIIKQAKN